MTYGLQVFNDTGLLQISEEYATHVVLSSGTVTAGTSIGGLGISMYEYSLTYPNALTGKDCFVWARPNTAPNATPEYLHTGVRVSATGTAFSLRHQTNSNVDYMITTPAYNAGEEADGYGLRVLSSTGQLVFSSKQQLCHVVTSMYIDPEQAVTIPPAYFLANLYSSTTVSWSNYYALMNTCVGTRVWGDAPNAAHSGPICKFWKDGATYKIDIVEYWLNMNANRTDDSMNDQPRVFMVASKGL